MASRSPSRQSDSSFGSTPQTQESSVGFFKKIWQNTGLDRPTVLLMMKYQAMPVAHEYTTLGYLVAIISILGFAIMPRAKFIQMMIFDVLAICIAACFALLTMYSSVKARQHTSTNGSDTYNSSASAVSGVWLFFQIWMVHTFRAKYPQLQFPVIIYAIFANVSSVYAPTMMNMASAISLVERMLKSFLTGLGISTATSMFILPMTSRQAVFKQMSGYISGLRSALNAHAVYFESLEKDDMFGRAETFDDAREKFGKKGKVYSPEAEAIRSAIRQITDVHAKLHGDLTFAKREIALGKLGPDDLQAIFRHLRQIMIPVVGLSFVVDIFQRLSDYNRWNQPIDMNIEVVPEDVRQRVVHEWNDIMRAVHDPFAMMIKTIDEGLLHTSYVFRLTKPPKRTNAASSATNDNASDENKDVEASAEDTAPGEKAFTEHFEKQLGEFRSAKRLALQTWAEEKGIKLPPDFFDHPTSPDILQSDFLDTSATQKERSRRQLYLFLYMEQLLYSTGQTVLDFVRYANHVEAKGKLSRTRLIIPGGKRIWKWVGSFLSAEDAHDDDNLGDIHTQNNILQLGEAYRLRKDPEHLPPTTLFQKCGDKIRVLPWFLRSFESTYGFRVALATMTIAVVAFLHDTQTFFTHQRLVWAMIMVNLSMSPTSGQSIFSFVLRILGTTIAMVASLLIWYIPGQKTPGVIVFLFIFVSMGFYIPIKLFRFRVVGMISIVTTTMIIAYELQVRRVGEAVATSNGQPFYPIYLLAPYRLATVSGGIAVAFFWTFFPYPISEHSILRQSLGASLYLLANYYSIIHETISGRMRGDEGDYLLKSSAGRKLEKARHKVFSKQMLMLAGLRTYSEFLRWEVPIGGQFPKKQYDSIILCVENIVNYLSLLGYASDTLMNLGDGDDVSDTAWMHDFRRLVGTAKVTTHEVTSLLCLLSASITNRQPLPPYLKAPRPYSFTKRLEALDSDILSLRHIAEPGFAAFAVLQISTRCIVGDVDRLLRCTNDGCRSRHQNPAASGTSSTCRTAQVALLYSHIVEMAQVKLDRSLLEQSAKKTVLITGAARGIGAATARLFNNFGANVILADLAELKDAAEEVIQTQLAHPERAKFFPTNIVNWAELTACFEAAIAKFGSIDIVVANAGIMESHPVFDLNAVDENGRLVENEDAGRVIDVNLKGTLNTLRLGLHYMKSDPEGLNKSILLVASTSSYFGGTGVGAYIASKHGVLGLLRASQDVARKNGVRVNAVAPFFTPTHITAGFSERWGQAGLERNTPDGVAEAIALVALDSGRQGHCILAAGKYLRELEETRTKLFSSWLGEDVTEFMASAMQFLVSIGGYVLPRR
ncbi:unnamed protein product [Penicillium salamii]|nr:unnamed protein product [Penicillium salamii]